MYSSIGESDMFYNYEYVEAYLIGVREMKLRGALATSKRILVFVSDEKDKWGLKQILHSWS